MTTYHLSGDPVLIAITIEGQTNVLGPVVLDGTAYTSIRSDGEITVPDGVTEIGPDLARVVLGVWM